MPVTANTTVTYKVSTPAAAAVVNAAVTAQLVGPGDRNDDGTVITTQISTTTDGTGAFSLSLVPNSAYRQTGTYYAVNIAGGPSYSIVVPVSGPAVSLWDCRVNPSTLAPVPAATPSIYLLRAERGAVSGVASLDASGLVPSAQLPSGASTPDATTTSKGIVQLAGDLAGTATAPTVPALTSKAATARQVIAGTGLSGGGDLTADRTLAVVYGTTAGTTAQGNDARLGGSLVYPLVEGYGMHSASIHPDNTKSAAAFAAWHTRIWVPANKAIATAGIFITTAAVGSATLAAFAVYADDGQTLLGSSAHNNALFLSTGFRSANLASSIAAQGSGRFVRVLVTSNYATSGPSANFASDANNDAAYNAGTGIRTAFFNALASFPASFNPTTGAGLAGWTASTFLPIILLG